MPVKRIIFFFLVFAAALAVFYFYKKYRVAPAIDVFHQQLLDENGNTFELNNLKGKKLIICYYASWCGDCLKEMKTLNEIQEKELADVTIVAITDETQEKLIAFKNKKQYPFIFLRLPVSFDQISIYAIPVTYIINQQGELVYEKVGAIQWNEPSFLAHLKALL